MADIISETYAELEAEKRQHINTVSKQIEELTAVREKSSMFKEGARTDDIIAKDTLNRKDLEILIDKIIVSKDGEPTIYLKANIEQLLNYDGGDDLDGSGGGDNKATVTYKAGAVTKSFVSIVAMENKAGHSATVMSINGGFHPSKEPFSTTKQALTASRDWPPDSWKESKAVTSMSSVCRFRCLATCWPNSVWRPFDVKLRPVRH